MASSTCKYDSTADLQINGCQLEFWEDGILKQAWNVCDATVSQRLGTDCYVVELADKSCKGTEKLIIDIDNTLTMEEVRDAACCNSEVNLGDVTIENLDQLAISPTKFCTADGGQIFVCKQGAASPTNASFQLFILRPGSTSLVPYASAVHGAMQSCTEMVSKSPIGKTYDATSCCPTGTVFCQTNSDGTQSFQWLADGGLTFTEYDAVTHGAYSSSPPCKPYHATFTGDDTSAVQPFNSFSVVKPRCCVVRVTTDAGSFLMTNSMVDLCPEKFDCALTAISVAVESGDCQLSDIHVHVQNTGSAVACS